MGLCLETFGLKKKGPTWIGQCVKDNRTRVLPVDFGKTNENDPHYCINKCKISEAPPAGYACHCRYQGYWTCGAVLKQCDEGANCPAGCTSKSCCKRGGGDCGGYWWWGL